MNSQSIYGALLICLGSCLGVSAQSPIFEPPPALEESLAAPATYGYAPPAQPYVDLDNMPQPQPCGDYWTYQNLPDGLIYKSYLAGAKESRMSSHFFYEKDDGWLWDMTLGGRVGIFRYGTQDRIRPQGFQFDVEGSAQGRLDLEDNIDFRSVDFRAGPIGTYGWGPNAIKFGYYHLSSHTGDEFLLKNPGFNRLNFARDVLIFGYSRYLTPELRLYGEIGWAFYTDISEPLELQFGFDWAPGYPTGVRGAPFVAVNGHLREELNFGGTFTAQAGWAWRGDNNAHLLRAGIHYQNGGSNQLSFFANSEQQIGAGLWYDY